MDKFIKLSAIAKLAQSKPGSKPEVEATEEEDMQEHGCKCACCGSPCDICAEEDTEHEEDEEEGYKPKSEY